MTDNDGNASKQPPPNHPRRFDVTTYRKISALDLRILEEIDFLSRLQAKHSLTGARYCTAGEAYFSRKCGVRREQISRRITHLSQIGVLDVCHRKPQRGLFRTNLYKIISWTWWKLRATTQMLRGKPDRVRPIAHKLISKREIYNSDRAKGAPSATNRTFSEYLASVKLKFPSLNWS